MPKLDYLTGMESDGRISRFSCINLHWSVGVSGDNGPADVMLVQAMFRYLGATRHSASKYFGLPLDQIPRITARIDAATKMAILAFQRRNNKRLLKIDGTVEPAKYEGRVIKDMTGRLMTITLLDQLVRHYAIYVNDEPDYVNAIVNFEPRLAPWLV